MKTIQVRLPDNAHSQVKRLSREKGVSLNQFIVTSVSNEVIREAGGWRCHALRP